MAIAEAVTGNDSVAITGTASAGERTVGVKGVGDSVGVHGRGKAWHGVEGLSDSTIGGFGVYGANTAGGTGVVGESSGWMGVYGKSKSTTGGAGVMGEGDPAPGVIGKSTKWIGVYGETAGVENGPAGVWGEHKGAGIGVKAISSSGVGLFAFSNGMAAVFHGNVDVSGVLTVQGLSVQALNQRLSQLEQQGASAAQVAQRVTALDTRVNTLQQQVNSLQQQLTALQQKHAEDVQGIANSLVTLAARVTALES